MYYCEECGKYFYESTTKRVYWESYFGVNLGGKTSGEINVCPHCESEDISELSRGDIAECIEDLFLDGKIEVDFGDLEDSLNGKDIQFELKKYGKK